MQKDDLAIWWASLTIAQKERIARKGQSKNTPDRVVDEDKVRYPACTTWWNGLSDAEKVKIHDHCVDRHSYLLHEWNDADPYGD